MTPTPDPTAQASAERPRWIMVALYPDGRVCSGAVLGCESEHEFRAEARRAGQRVLLVPGPVVLGQPLTPQQAAAVEDIHAALYALSAPAPAPAPSEGAAEVLEKLARYVELSRAWDGLDSSVEMPMIEADKALYALDPAHLRSLARTLPPTPGPAQAPASAGLREGIQQLQDWAVRERDEAWAAEKEAREAGLIPGPLDWRHTKGAALLLLVGKLSRLLATPPAAARAGANFQDRGVAWVREAFGSEPADCKEERAHRFLEEALEAVQAAGTTEQEAAQLVEYVYGRSTGEVAQEIGGVMLTLAPFAAAFGVNMHAAGEAELARVNTPEVIAKCRAKNASKPKNSPLPGTATPAQDNPA